MSQLLGDCVEDVTSLGGGREGRLLLQDQPALSEESPDPSWPQCPPSQSGEEVSQAAFLHLMWKGSFTAPGVAALPAGRVQVSAFED